MPLLGSAQVAQLLQVTGHAAETPGRPQRLAVLDLATHVQCLWTIFPFLWVICSLSDVSMICIVGPLVGILVGDRVVTLIVGLLVGAWVGAFVGAWVGAFVGALIQLPQVLLQMLFVAAHRPLILFANLPTHSQFLSIFLPL